jgi:ATP-dependent helicase/nuclease subunit A
MNAARHLMILASAGSGKTFALTNRFIALLAQGASPDRIVALTFTRKAAGEFFDEILNKLARAAADVEAARRLAIAIGSTELGPGDFLKMLRAVVDHMHRLQLGTLDSFFARVARAFPLELGLAGDFEILQEHSSHLERRRVLRQMFARSGDLAAPQKDFVEAFKRATFGAEEKRLGSRLDAFLDEHQEKYLAAPTETLWGQAERIWPAGNEWLQSKVDVAAASDRLREWLRTASVGEKQRERWEAFLTALADWAPGIPPPRELAYVLEKVLAAWPEIAAGRAVLEFDRKAQELDPRACAALGDLTRHVVGGELTRRLTVTRGIYAVLRGFESYYHDTVRRAGKVTFGDVQRLLVPKENGLVLSREMPDGDIVDRLFIDYRLDAQIDHWLLDEFQDTSFGQWSVLRNLIDEVVQDAEGRKSFFCVGDVKQAIFTWREGDPRLFREIFNHYNSAQPGIIGEARLVDSWRSGPALIEMVNAVFGAAPVLDKLFPGEASRTWNREWSAHRSAVPERAGQAALLHAEDESERWALALKLLQEIRPIERGLSCAVLVQTNALASEFADFLRREGGLPAQAESDLHVCTDNPLGASLLALVRASAHPGDTLAWEHVWMTPLGAILTAENVRTPEALTERVLARVHADGFERALEHWMRELERTLPAADTFSRLRARQFAQAAALFDETGSRNADEFLEFMQKHVVRDAEGGAVIRVMTVHKSKGLGFDVVVLPDLEGSKLDSRRDGLAVQRAVDRTVEWVLDIPPRLFWERDEVLNRHVCAAEADACYEALSLLYVAMTRAKRGMYLIAKPPGRSTSRNYPRLLAETLGDAAVPVRVGSLELKGAWARGTPDWFVASVTTPSNPSVDTGIPAISLAQMASAPRPLLRRRPSADRAGWMNAGPLFSSESAAASSFGSTVHALLAEVEWIEPREIAARIRHWQSRDFDASAVDEAAACLASPELAAIWRKEVSLDRVEIWRERAFEAVVAGDWVTGVFDRVAVVRDARGRASRGTVYDFKTDRLVSEADVERAVRSHSAQMNLYRAVASRLTGVGETAIACALVFTRLRRVVVVPRPA